METKVSTKRLGYIDALRGLTILLVVYPHVELFCFGISYHKSPITSIVYTFQMPIFFLISGFVAYKSTEWDSYKYFHLLKKKGILLIIPTLFFYYLNGWMNGNTNISSFFDQGPGQYWFTLALFYMFLIYYTVMYLCRNYSSKVADIGLIALSFFGSLIYIGGMKFYNLEEYAILCPTNVSRYFGYFTLGILAKKYHQQFILFITSEKLKAFLLLAFTGIFIITWNETIIHYSLIHIFNLEFTLRILGVLLVFSVFYQYRNFFDSDIRPVRWLRLVGRRTLDIYMLHYFFLPDLKFMTPWLSEHKQIGGGGRIFPINLFVNSHYCYMFNSQRNHSEQFLFRSLPIRSKIYA